jgi:ABC-type microcin C transport system permease subunit YejE
MIRRSRSGVLISFLLGVSWAFVLIGAIYTFFSFYLFGLTEALLMTFFGALPGLFLVVILGHILTGAACLEEMKKHTELLEKISLGHASHPETPL